MSRKPNRIIVFCLCFLLIISSVCLSGCKPIKKAVLSITLSRYDENYEKILAVCSGDFIGNHPVDESFFGWFNAKYGENRLQAIVDNMDFEDPDVWYALCGKSIHVLWYEYCSQCGFDSPELSRTTVIDTNSDDYVTLEFTGDLGLVDNTSTMAYLNSHGGITSCFSEDLLSETMGADIFMINSENTFSERGVPIPNKAYTLRGNPSYAAWYNDIGVDIVSLANNHVYDFGPDAFNDTIDAVESINMPYVGAGHDINEAKRPWYFIANGKKIAILSATQIERSYTYTKPADDVSGGVLKCLNPAEFTDAIKYADRNADVVIVMVHWGTEGNEDFGDDQRNLARKFADAGADAIVGGHTHCLQGFDMMGKTPVYYSLGNYWFATTMNMPADYDSGIAKLKVYNSGDIEASFKYCRFHNGVTSLVTDNAVCKEIEDKFNELSGDAYLSNGVITPKQ